jgi:hypothetical protein
MNLFCHIPDPRRPVAQFPSVFAGPGRNATVPRYSAIRSPANVLAKAGGLARGAQGLCPIIVRIARFSALTCACPVEEA